MPKVKYQPTILLVDDNNANLDLLESVLDEINVRIIRALSGQEALNKTDGTEIALAIVDVRMPGMSGFENL